MLPCLWVLPLCAAASSTSLDAGFPMIALPMAFVQLHAPAAMRSSVIAKNVTLPPLLQHLSVTDSHARDATVDSLVLLISLQPTFLPPPTLPSPHQLSAISQLPPLTPSPIPPSPPPPLELWQLPPLTPAGSLPPSPSPPTQPSPTKKSTSIHSTAATARAPHSLPAPPQLQVIDTSTTVLVGTLYRVLGHCESQGFTNIKMTLGAREFRYESAEGVV